MSDITKRALGESLKELLRSKPLSKITIRDITDGCGVNRMTFYYHFHDIYELLEWSLLQEAESALAGKLSYDTWQEGLATVFALLLDNKPFIMNIYRDINRDLLEQYLFGLAGDPYTKIIEEAFHGHALSAENERFLANFFHHAFLGLLQQWIREDMKEEPAAIIHRLSLLIEGSAPGIIQAFSGS